MVPDELLLFLAEMIYQALEQAQLGNLEHSILNLLAGGLFEIPVKMLSIEQKVFFDRFRDDALDDEPRIRYGLHVFSYLSNDTQL